MLCAAVKVCVQQGVAMVPRGGGASYTDGYLLAGEDHVLIDTCALDMIEIDEANALVWVGAGVTWATLRAALAAKGLRTPFWGPLLVTGDNFGCGSSREQAPWALADLGVRVLITTRFDEIFQSNCFKNGMLPIVLADHDVALLDAAAKAGEPFTVDLEAQQIRLPRPAPSPSPSNPPGAKPCATGGTKSPASALASEPPSPPSNDNSAPKPPGCGPPNKDSRMADSKIADQRLKTKLAEGKFFVVPGVQDMIAAVTADRVGFDIVYGTGYWLTASAYGLPDAGIATYTQMIDRMATLARTSKAAVIADADTGYGGLLNVHHTVKGYEAAGIAAIQLEDQAFPKKCGHTPYKRLISTEDMVEKIKVAVAARDEMLVIARTDARQSEGMDGALRRLEAYAKAGADVLFPEAMTSEEEMGIACAAFDKPVMANMSNGGLTPVLKGSELAEIGFAFAIYPSQTSLVAVSAMEAMLRRLKDDGDGNPADIALFDFTTFCRMIGFEDVWAFEEQWSAKR